ncbi:MAG: hypothetical protein HYV05_11250 [Deltaproteobacteria bacterium]|nr:hypothetical protein [Deltaproteobacteria bacterium]
MDSRTSAWISGSCSPSMLTVPLVWKPPMMTSIPAARNRRPRSKALGNWLVWTPTNPTTSLVEGRRLQRMIFFTGTFSVVSSKVMISILRSPKTRFFFTSSVRPFRTLSVLLGSTPFQKRMT